MRAEAQVVPCSGSASGGAGLRVRTGPRGAPADPRRGHRRRRHERDRAGAPGDGPPRLGLGPEGFAGRRAPALPRDHRGRRAPAGERCRRRGGHLLAGGAGREPRAARGAGPGRARRSPLRDARRHLRHPTLPGRRGDAREDDDGVHAVADPGGGGTAAVVRHRGRRQRDRDERGVGLGGVARRRG